MFNIYAQEWEYRTYVGIKILGITYLSRKQNIKMNNHYCFRGFYFSRYMASYLAMS